MTTILLLRWLHLVAMATWVGGMIVLPPLVGALRSKGVERETIRAAAAVYARVSWIAMAVAVATGLAQVQVLHLDWGYGRLHLKVGLVALTILIALLHQRMAHRLKPAARGLTEAGILLASLAVVAAAMRL